MALPAGSVLAHRYRLGAPLGRGASAQAYLAEDLLEGAQVALKLLHPAHELHALRREFELLRGLIHPHLARVHDFAVTRIGGQRRALYTSDLVLGGDLRAHVAQVGFPAARVALADVLDALHLLHRVGLRHGDVKPENVLVDAHGRGVLIDLGCAAPLGQVALRVSGTPHYMAPELRQGEVADERADLFAFGVMLGELSQAPEHAALIARLTAALPRARPSSAREVLSALGDQRDVESSTHGRAARCLGRDAELAHVEQVLTSSALRGAPGPCCVWVEGHAGVGRSRFLREVCFLLARAELDVLPASEASRTPVRDALARHGIAAAAGFEALREQLEEFSLACEPCVLVLDDAQRLDPDAQLELRFALGSLPPKGRLCMLIASTEAPPELESESVLLLRLAPLSEPVLAEWSAGVLHDPARVRELLRFTGGYPRYVERALAALIAGRMRESELFAGLASELDAPSARALALSLADLSPSEQRALCEVALLGRSTSPPSRRLFERELLSWRGAQLALARDADRAPLLAQLDPKLVSRAHGEAARTLSTERTPEAVAQAIAYYARAGEVGQARALLDRNAELALRAPRVFSQRIAVHSDWLQAGQRVLLARLLRLSGEAPRALHELAQARRTLASPGLYLEAAEVYLALGRPQRAEWALGRCRDAGQLLHAELLARVLIRRGAYERAVAVATGALASDLSSPERARLLESLALAYAYRGQLDAAREQVEQALSLHPAGEIRARARCLSLRGFILLRAGATVEAVAAYSAAFELAEPHGLVDLVLNALANLGNARQSLGQWGRALETYERALRLSAALGRQSSVRSVRANLANLALEIGAFARAEEELDALAKVPSTQAGSAALALSIALYRAELTLLQGDAAGALSALDALLAEACTPPRELVEANVLRLSALLALGDASRLAGARVQLASLTREQPVDLVARVAEVEARALAAEGQAKLGIEKLELALARVKLGDDQALLARLESALSQLCRGLGAVALAAEHEARARGRWERIALDLPARLRDTFWAHPRRASFAAVAVERAALPVGRATLSLSRVRELNRRIGALHQRDEVLAFALDAAIELTGAERGFVLLCEPTAGERGFNVAAARNMEGARMRKSEWKWSRSIAERVIRQAEPVVTVDAGNDPRFARKASVHAMRLKSVLCAPIRGQSAVIGALYLDNRLAHARFAADDAELLLTFADQVAIALAHADLVLLLETKARELAREKRKVELLARGQASEIERLSEELSAQRVALATRYDYHSIVARSEPMQKVLALLDRVTDTDLSVLVQGESGTGKELVARALHMNGPRRRRPFVGINCAALPEALLESELFGHVKGAFTGASSAREGLFVSARSGTLFLDELGDLPLSMQAKLLRVLNDGEVRAVGATKSQAVDVRLVCATNRNLKRCVAEGSFREDLYYRVGVVELTLPPLRERLDDIVPIAEKVLQSYAAQTGTEACRLSVEAVRALLAHAWPGNVRELQNTLLRASVMASDKLIREADLALTPRPAKARAAPGNRTEYVQKEAERLLFALEAERWNVSKVAKNLGIPRNTLYRKLQRHGIHRAGD